MSPLQKAVLDVVSLILKPIDKLGIKNILEYNEQQPMYPTVFDLLLHFVEYACCPPKVESHDKENYTSVRGRAGEWVVMNYVPLAESSLKMIGDLYSVSNAKKTVVEGNVLQKILQVSFTYCYHQNLLGKGFTSFVLQNLNPLLNIAGAEA